MANAHEGRFDNINKEPSIFSKSKKNPEINFDKMNKQARHKCLVNADSEVSMQKYIINTNLTNKKTPSLVSIDKMINWDKVVDNDKKPTS